MLSNEIVIRWSKRCSDSQCKRQWNYWGEFTEFHQIDLTDMEDMGKKKLFAAGWFRDVLTDQWLCPRHLLSLSEEK